MKRCSRLRWRACAIAAGMLVVAATSGAAAQTRRAPTGFVLVGGGQQGQTPGFSERDVFSLHAEQAVVETRYDGRGGSLFDISGGVLVWRQLFVGAGLSLTSHSHSADTGAVLPHPFFFGRARTADWTASGLIRKEQAVHVPVIWQIRAADRIDMMVFGGPSFLSISQDFVDVVSYGEAYPFDTAIITDVTRKAISITKTVPHLGVALLYRLTPRIAGGLQVRHASARVDFELDAGRLVAAKVGGTQVSSGLRFRF